MTKREEGTVAEPTSTQATGEDEDLQPEEGAEAAPSEYTTETSAEAGRRAAARPVVTGRAMGTGRRKEAIARVRIAPGTGQWLVNDRPLEKFFPNKVHQQLISEPLVTLGAEGQFDIVARGSGGGVAGPAGARLARGAEWPGRRARCGWGSRARSPWWIPRTGPPSSGRAS